MSGHRDPEESEDGLGEDGHQHKSARSAEHRRGVGEDEGADDIARRLLRHPQQRGQRDLLRLPLEYFQDRHAFDALFGKHLLEDRGLGDAEPDPQTDPDHDNAEKERDPPSPNQELVAGKPAEEQHRQIRQEQSGGAAELRPGGEQAAIFVGSRPFHRQQYRSTPFAADADPLDRPDDHQEDSPPNADALIGRHETDGHSRKAGDQQGRDQRCLAPDPVAPMAEYRRADRPTEKPYEKTANAWSTPTNGSDCGKKSLPKTRPVT